MTTDILESEQKKILREAENDLLRAIPERPAVKRRASDLPPGKPRGLIETMQRTLLPRGVFPPPRRRHSP